jgi:hypothetical protein
VDLNLDGFDLSSATRVERRAAAAATSAAVGEVFWASLEGDLEPVFKEEDHSLLKNVFNPLLSDRRAEGDRFVPPDTGFAYVQHLRSLVKEEEISRQRRTHHFLGREFSIEDPGPLFPSTWKTSFEIAQQQHRPASLPLQGLLHERPDYKSEALVLQRILRSSEPMFDMAAEDGMRFRIYRVGSLEIRTTQEHEGQEQVGVVYSVHAARHATAEGQWSQDAIEGERVVKATEYVESAGPDSLAEQSHAYVVLETEKGTAIVTELLEGGVATWEVNPSALDVRNSLARVFVSGDCREAGTTVKHLQEFRAQQAAALLAAPMAAPSQARRYAAGALRRAQGARSNAAAPTAVRG